jgi:hypothetical protein
MLKLYLVNENEKMELEYLRKEVILAKTKAAEVRRFGYIFRRKTKRKKLKIEALKTSPVTQKRTM